jgi:peptide/nickel transport system permease protein
MTGYLARRVFMALATIVVAVVLSFLLVHLTPGSPGQLILGAGATKAQIAAKNSQIGWNQPLLIQLGRYLAGVVRGNLGTSIIDGHSIGHDLLQRLPVTGLIAVLAAAVSAVAGTALGLLAATRHGAVDRAVDTTSGVALSLPSFWVGVLLVYALSINAGLLPATGYVSPGQSLTGWLQSITLPVMALAIPATAIVVRTARAALAQALRQPHIQMLRSLGEPPWRLLLIHVLRSASVPVVSVLGVQFVALFSGSVIIENLFALPGLGQAASNGITSYDFPAVEGVVLVASLVVVLVNLLLDLLVAGIDPRVRAT